MLIGVLGWSAAAQAAGYPDHPIKIIIPFAAGGGGDTYARPLAQLMSQSMGQPVVVENVTGAGGVIGTQAALRAPADGYTMLMIANSNVINETLYPRRGFDLLKDFAPVTLMAKLPLVLVVNPSLPVKSVAELIALAKSKPGQLNYASSGAGTTYHLPMELLKAKAGIDIVHVPYKSSSAARTDMVGGQVQMMLDGFVTMRPQIQSGAARAIAVTSEKRIETAPDLPTIGETVPGFAAEAWAGFVVRAGTPPEIIARLQKEIAAVLARPEMQESYRKLDSQIVADTPAEFGAFMQSELVKWRAMVQDAHVKLIE